MRDSTYQLRITIQIDIWFDCVFLKENKKPIQCNESACQVSYRRVLMTKESACGFLKCGFL